MKLRELATFCWADTEFFEKPALVNDLDSRYPDPTGLDETVWQRIDSGIWIQLRPIGVELPEQGWKIHVSSTPETAPKVLEIVWTYCVDHQVTFKFVRSDMLLRLLNQKGNNRGSSGKFVTIYPCDEAELQNIMRNLEPALAGFEGPYLISDLRHRNGPLYVRYGAFRPLWCADQNGDPVLAARTPDATTVPDSRTAGFAVAEWVRMPEFLATDLAARRRQSTDEFPYRIERVIQFSTSGGVYAATDQRTDEPVVVREARPHAGLDPDGNDAVHRLCRERDLRAKLIGLTCVPRLVDYRVVDGHHYLIEEHIDGQSVLELIQARYPLVTPHVPEAQLASYVAWAAEVTNRIAAALAAVHHRGVSYGDLHPGNILVRADGAVVLLDFEFAAPLRDNRRSAAAAPGFAAPAPLAGAPADRYALERLRLMALLPVMALIERDLAKPATLIDAVSQELPVRPSALARLRRHLTDPDAAPDRPSALFGADPARLPEIEDSLARAIHASATPQRTDRLFPGDPAQFGTGGTDVESGAAGVLYALHQAGATVAQRHLDWLAHRAMDQARPWPGLFNGLHGVAVVLDELGRPDQAQQVMDLAHASGLHCRLAGLRGGQAGMALAALRLARRTGSPQLLQRAVTTADRLQQLVNDDQTAELRPPDRAGLMHGLTGVAALFLALHEHLGEEHYLTLAEICLHRDLGRCKSRSPGTCYVLDGSRHLPYPDNGSLGLAMVMAQYLRHRPNPIFQATVSAVRTSCDIPYSFQSGILQGRAGLILGLAAIGHPGDATLIQGQLRRLGWHALSYRGELAFPGTQNLRLSMDYGTGTAGVLLAVHAARTGSCHYLPALESLTRGTAGS